MKNILRLFHRNSEKNLKILEKKRNKFEKKLWNFLKKLKMLKEIRNSNKISWRKFKNFEKITNFERKKFLKKIKNFETLKNFEKKFLQKN